MRVSIGILGLLISLFFISGCTSVTPQTKVTDSAPPMHRSLASDTESLVNKKVKGLLTETEIRAEVLSALAQEAASAESSTSAILANIRKDSTDGRNRNGGFPTVFKETDFELVLIGTNVNTRSNCGEKTSELDRCVTQSLAHDYLALIKKQMCHNAGCDSARVAIVISAAMESIEEGKVKSTNLIIGRPELGNFYSEALSEWLKTQR